MSKLLPNPIVIHVSGDITKITQTHLQLSLAATPLTKMQLAVATALAVRYTEYISNEVKEPYASTLLFSTSVRKSICKELDIKAPNLNNLLIALVSAGVLGKTDDNEYMMNPNVLPVRELTFKFTLIQDGRQQNQNHIGSSPKDGADSTSGERNSIIQNVTSTTEYTE